MCQLNTHSVLTRSVILEEISNGWIGTAGFAQGPLVFACFCNKNQREKRFKHKVFGCLGAADLNISKTFAGKETNIIPS